MSHGVVHITDADIFVCVDCEKVVDEAHGTIARKTTRGTKNGVYIDRKPVVKYFIDEIRHKCVRSFKSIIWNYKTGKLFYKFSTHSSIVYNRLKKRLYRVWRAKKRGRRWRVIDVTYSPWGRFSPEEFGISHEYIAARGNGRLENFFNLIGTWNRDLATRLKGDDSFSQFDINQRHIEIITTQQTPVAEAIARMVASGWTSVGINAIMGEAGIHVAAYKSYAYSSEDTKMKISGNERQRGKIVGRVLSDSGSGGISDVYDALGWKMGKLSYKRLERGDWSHLIAYSDNQIKERRYGDPELRRYFVRFLRENRSDIVIKQDKTRNSIRLVCNEVYYAIIPAAEEIVALRDDGAEISISVADPKSFDTVLAFIK